MSYKNRPMEIIQRNPNKYEICVKGGFYGIAQNNDLIDEYLNMDTFHKKKTNCKLCMQNHPSRDIRGVATKLKINLNKCDCTKISKFI